ncbi:MAG TPA: gas vesicle protein GvpG [Thermoanaerobaculia bacterium]
MAFLLDDILLAPIKLPIAGFNWILRQVQTMANEELLNDQPWKERLIELQMMLEVGDISEAEYAEEEKKVFQALRDIRARKKELAREDREEEEGGVRIYTGYGE